MKIITTTGSKSQKPHASINLCINQLSERLRDAKSPEESRDLLAFFIEATEDGIVKNWLLEFQRIFQPINPEAKMTITLPQVTNNENVQNRPNREESEIKSFSLPSSEVNKLFRETNPFPFLNKVKGLDVLLNSLQKINSQRFYDATHRYGVFTEPFKAKKFYEICAGENIIVSRSRKLINGAIQGFYAPRLNTIWLKPCLRKAALLQTMAHELAHHFLHRERLLNGEIPITPLFKAENAPDERVLRAELEAELFSCVFLIEKSQIKETKC